MTSSCLSRPGERKKGRRRKRKVRNVMRTGKKESRGKRRGQRLSVSSPHGPSSKIKFHNVSFLSPVLLHSLSLLRSGLPACLLDSLSTLFYFTPALLSLVLISLHLLSLFSSSVCCHKKFFFRTTRLNVSERSGPICFVTDGKVFDM